MTGFVVATDSRHCDEVLFMVDRSVQRKSFWSNSIEDAFVFADSGAAHRKAGTLNFNNPRVLTLDEATKISSEQWSERAHDAALADSDESLSEAGDHR